MITEEEVARQCLRGIRGAITDSQYIDALGRIEAALKAQSPAIGGAREIAAEIGILVNEFDLSNSDWGFRKGVINAALDRLRALTQPQEKGR